MLHSASIQTSVDSVSKWVVNTVSSGFTGLMSGLGYSYNDEESVEEEDELEIDDSLSPIERIKKYTNSDLILHRLHLVRELCELGVQIGYEDTKVHIIPTLQNLSNDPEAVIRQALAEQLTEFSVFFSEAGGEDGAEQIQTVIIPIIAILASDEHVQVRGTVAQTIVKVVGLLNEEQQSKYMVPVLSRLASDKYEEELRIQAAELFQKTCCSVSPEIVTSIYLDHLTNLAGDGMFRVRKATVTGLGSISKMVGPEITVEKVLPVFRKLTKDDIWGVRKACAETMVDISWSVPQECRLGDLTSIYDGLIQDTSRWVRNSAFQHLGQFITSLEEKTVPPVLLNYYTSMIEGPKNKYGDSDTVMYCAYSFPGVLYTAGAENWEKLKPVYFSLVKDLQWKVRRTLSHSLHEIAKILGEQLTEEYLLETFEMFLNDLDQVKVGVIRHLSEFLAVLSPETRIQYVDSLQELQREVNWRFRKLIAKQMGRISSLFDDETVQVSILPIAVLLLDDQVTTVRLAICKEVASILEYLSKRENKQLLQDFVDHLLQFATKPSCYERQSFALACENVAASPGTQALFKEKFFPKLLPLCKDKVANVRFIVSRIFSQTLQNSGQFTEEAAQIEAAVKDFKEDKDREVRYYTKINA